VLGRGGGSSPPIKSATGAGFGGAGGAFRSEADRSIFAFSCTTFKGCDETGQHRITREPATVLTTSSSPSTSSVAGSGMPPSMTHLFDSYLVRMKFSILL
jgi:hypothetical protein